MSAEYERMQRRCAELERLLQQAEHKAAYYQKMAEQTGIARLREAETLSRLLNQHKKAEEQLLFQAALLEQMQDTVIATDLDGHITYVNESACRLMQRDRAELLGSTIWSLGEDPKRGATQQEILDQTLTNGTWRGLVINHAADGTELIFDTRTWLTHNDDGTLAGIVGISTNVTARKQAEEEIQIILRTVHDGFSLIDMRGHFLYVNDTYCRMLGYRREEFLSLTIAELNVEYHSPKDAFQRIERLKKAGSDVFETVLRRKDGTLIDVEIRATYMNLSDGRMLAFVRDITERKRAEAAIKKAHATLKARVEELSTLNKITQTVTKVVDLQALLNVVADIMTHQFQAHETVITLLDDSQTALTVVTHVVSASAVFPKGIKEKSLRGFRLPLATTPSVSRLLEAQQSIVVPHAQIAPETSAFHDILKARSTQCLMNIPLQSRAEVIGIITIATNDASREFLPEEVTLAETIAGQVAGSLENARLFDEARKARQEAEIANSAKSEFLSRMSHELRTPLNIILGNVYLMRGTEITAEQREALDTIQTASSDLLRLIVAMLDFSHIKTGALELTSSPFRLDELLKRLFQQYERRTHAKLLDISCDIDKHIPVSLMGDTHQLEQVLTHLLENAIEFTEHGRIAVQVERADSDELTADRIFLRFSVSDTGVGIPHEKISELFLPFHQLDGSHTRTHGGTGIGLALCKHLVEMMNGRIWAVSHPGQGSTFFFTASFLQAVDTPDIAQPPSTPFFFESKAIPTRQTDKISREREPTSSFDVTEVLPVLKRFAQLLAEHDMEAIEYGKLLTNCLQDAHVDAELQDIQHCLKSYEFEKTSEVLARMTHRLGFSLESL